MKYRKKPVVIEAKQFYGTKKTADEIKLWGRGWGVQITDGEMLDDEHTPTLDINTLGGGIRVAQPGDWIIRDIQNEFYSCKPDIFESTHEPVDED